MKARKIRLYHKPVNGLGISRKGGFVNLMQDVSVTLVLSPKEAEELKIELSTRLSQTPNFIYPKTKMVTMALYGFTHGSACTKHHKYKIWNTFDGISDINYEWL